MSNTTPTYPDAQPDVPTRSFSGSSSTFQSIFHSSTSTACSGPSTPRTSLSRSPTAETTLFARIRSSRSRSPASRSPARTRTSSSPTSTSSPSPTSEEHPGRSRLHFRTDSSTSTASHAGRPRSRSTKRHSGTVMQCGRHGNDWLFGGFSFTEAVKGLLSPTHDGEHPPSRH